MYINYIYYTTYVWYSFESNNAVVNIENIVVRKKKKNKDRVYIYVCNDDDDENNDENDR